MFVLGVFGEPADVMFIGNIGENGVITGTMDIGGGLTTGTFTVVRAEGAATLPEPVLSPVAVAPELLNRSEVQASLDEYLSSRPQKGRNWRAGVALAIHLGNGPGPGSEGLSDLR